MSSTPAVDPVPVSSAARAAEQAGIILAAVVLVALALPAANRLVTTTLPRWLAIAAIAFAVLTVVAGLGAVVLRGAGGRPRPQASLAMMSGVSLLVATALAGSAAVALLASGPRSVPAAEGLTIVISGVGEGSVLTMTAEMPGVAAGDMVRAEVTAEPDSGDRTVLARQVTVARSDGPVSVTLVAQAVNEHGMLRVLVESPERRCTASVRPQVSEVPIASCKAR
jgi:hypothetical protein